MLIIIIKKLKNIKLVFSSYIIFIGLIRIIVRFISKFLPIYNNVILMKSYNGKSFCCNPKYLLNYLYYKGNNELEFVLALNKTKIEKRKYYKIKVVRNKSLKYYWTYLTSKYIITNDFFNIYLPERREQIYINTWHGGGAYKKVGYSLKTNLECFKKLYYEWTHNCDYMISSSSETTKAFIESFGLEEDKILNIGMPRNDLFFYKERVEKANIIVRKKYNIENKECIILYAPTWRDNNREIINEIRELKVLKAFAKITNKKVKIFIRAHYNTKKYYADSNCINVTDYPDMQELLCAADILITDYSSCMWDFSLMYKPCFIYATDIDQYKQERDFYTPMSEWPFLIATNTDELISNILNFNQAEYVEKVKQHHKALGSFEDGHACERVCKLIEDIIDGKVQK